MSGVMQGIGIGPGSPNTWGEYPALSPVLKDALDSMMTPAAYKALHYHSDTFEKIFPLRHTQFEELPIFQIRQQNVLPARTELEGFTVVKRDGSIVDTLMSEVERSVYRSVFAQSRDVMGYNYRVAQKNVEDGNTQDVDSLSNLGFAFAMHRSDQRLVLKGFFPYFSVAHNGQCVLFFYHSALHRIVLIAAPIAEREHALNFILTHGALHTFDKMCAHCGKTGGLRKCKCKSVRYCTVECQTLHWPSHEAECRAARKRAQTASTPMTTTSAA